MGELLGPLHEESYAHVDEVKGDAYGFGGLTQERRYIAGKAAQKTSEQTCFVLRKHSTLQTALRGRFSCLH